MNKLYFNTQYIYSAQTWPQLPPDQGAEIAFAGRSNAGKSSAINKITRQRNLARVSKTPGRTQMINYFQIDEERFLVDLPGYGYAKTSQKTRRHWQQMLQKYFTQRKALKGLMLIMDIRHPLNELDWQMIEWCKNTNLALHILLSKTDKLSRGAAQNTMMRTLHALEEKNVDASMQLFSATNNIGLEDAHTILDQWFEQTIDKTDRQKHL